jgi:hypothetical protein
VIICEVFGMHHQLGGSTEDDMNKMSVIGHISLFKVTKSVILLLKSYPPGDHILPDGSIFFPH